MLRIAVIIIVILAVCTLAAVLLGKFMWNNNKNIAGSWYREVDLTESVDKRMCAWLGTETVEGLDPVKVKVVLNIEETDTDALYNYSISLDEESYKEAYDTARAGMADEINRLVLTKTGQAGYNLSDEEEAQSVVEEALGMSLDDYIKEYLPALLSEYDDLNKDYARSGSFSLNDSQITWNTDGEEMQETWVMQDNLLIFSGTTDRVYRRL